MPGAKTSVWLGEEQVSQWKASGLSLTEIVKRGLAALDLAAPDPQEASIDAIRAAIREELDAAEERIRRIVRDELEAVASR
jgi:hypothetical protein